MLQIVTEYSAAQVPDHLSPTSTPMAALLIGHVDPLRSLFAPCPRRARSAPSGHVLARRCTKRSLVIAAVILGVGLGREPAMVWAQEEPAPEATPSTGAGNSPAPALECATHEVAGPEGTPDRRAVRKAKKMADKAARRCKRKKYAACAALLRSAYAKNGASEHLRALADAYELGAREEPAMCALQQYLRVDANAADRAAIETRLGALRQRREARYRAEQESFAALAEVQNAIDCRDSAWPGPAEKPAGRAARKARRAVKKRVKKARAQCRAERHAECVTSWQAAYAIDGDGAHLRAAAPAYVALEQFDSAICAYRQYLDNPPEGADKPAVVEQVLATYRDYLAAEERAAEREKAQAAEREKLARTEAEIASAVAAIGCDTRRLKGPEKRVTERERGKARARLKKAQELCTAQRVKECADELQSAYQLDGNNLHLLSIAFQYGQMREYESAICYYHQFLTSEPPEEYVAGSRVKLATMSEEYNRARRTEAELEQTKKMADKTQSELKKTAETLEQEAKAREALAKEAEQKSEELAETKEVLETTSTWIKESGRSTAGTTQRYIGIGLLGVGALGVGIGVLSALDARSTEATIEETTVWGDEFDEMIARGESASQRAVIFSAVGGVALIGGAVMVWLGERASKNVEVDVDMPTGRTGRTFVRVRGRF